MKNSFHNIAVLVLAAGASSRMGGTKQLLPWKDTTLLGQSLRTAGDLKAGSLAVVLGANAEAIQKGISEEKVDVVINSDWQSGLGSSIASGTDFLLGKNKQLEGILIMLADQPLIDTNYLNTMMANFRKAEEKIIATAYEHRAGVPALFGTTYFKPLMELHDDFGAKHIIDNHTDHLLVLDPGDKTVDVDTKFEYNKLITKYL